MWAHTEPPLTIGRGLLVTTGAIGGLLSLAVLWAMLPSAGRGGVAAPTVVTSFANDPPGATVTGRADTFVATSVELRLTSTTMRAGPVNVSAPEQSTTTTLELPQPTVSIRRTNFESAPVAVGIDDSLVITTARAVNGRTVITLTGADGRPHDATVVKVDPDLGLALLSADTAWFAGSYSIGPAVNAGDVVIVRSAEPTSANVSIDADGHLVLDTWGASMAEGTPVVNADGLLVGMCSRGASGPELVSVADVAAMLPAPQPAQPVAWLGVHVVDGAQGMPTIDGVEATGPAAAAGIVAGDIITAVDGVAVGGADQLKAAIDQHAPADVVALTITHADQTSGEVAVTLGTAPSV